MTGTGNASYSAPSGNIMLTRIDAGTMPAAISRNDTAGRSLGAKGDDTECVVQ